MRALDKLLLLRSYRESGGTGPYTSLLKERRKFDLGGEKDEPSKNSIYTAGVDKNSQKEFSQEYVIEDKSRVSSGYIDNFPNIKKFIPELSKLGMGDYSKSDSAIFTPALTRFNEVANLLPDNKILPNLVENLSSPVLKFKENPPNSQQAKQILTNGMSEALVKEEKINEMNEKVINLPQKELIDLLSTNYQEINKLPITQQIIEISKLKPSNISYLDAYQYYNFLNESPFSAMISRKLNKPKDSFYLNQYRVNKMKKDKLENKTTK